MRILRCEMELSGDDVDMAEGDIGTASCVDCRKRAGAVSHPELAAALARCDRQSGGATPRVAWISEKAPCWLWASTPPAKENARRVLVLDVDPPSEQRKA